MFRIERVHISKWLFLATVLAPLLTVQAAQPTDEDRRNLIGDPVSLVVQPGEVHLSSPRALQQIVVTGIYRDATQRDLTAYCTLAAHDAEIVTIGNGGLLTPLKNGRSTIVVRAGSRTAALPVVIEGFDKPETITFRHDFIAALNVAGCNQGSCHGILSGRGGFRLSLRGYDPVADYLELTQGAFGRRTNSFDAEDSLIYAKGLGRIPHQGGKRFAAGDVAARTILGWLRQGMPNDPAELPALTSLEVLPGQRVLHAPARWQQLAVLAHFADGSVRDVTRLTVFSSSDDSLALVDANGWVELRHSGEAAILCRYLDIIQCVRLTYLEPREGFRWSNPPENNEVDRHVFAKLRVLNILPAELCTDQEFLRRTYLDLCGILPAPEDVTKFLADRSPNKRAILIDTLLDRPEFADFWAYHWLDVLRCNRLHLQIKGAHVYHQWLRRHVVNNTPWSQVVSELLTATGSSFMNPAANYFRGAYDSNKPPAVRDPQELAETTAQLFFGIRMQCAKCHNHPFERWTQDDYYHMAAWFPQVTAKPDVIHPGGKASRLSWQLREDAIFIYPLRDAEISHPRTGQRMAPKIMGLPAPVIAPGDDRRTTLARLVTAADNPFFAKATVNRVWFQLLGRGIVDPPDDFRDSNPPANDALLDALARDFVAHGFDMQHLIHTIVNSRTYQLSARGDSTNQDDDKYFSHALLNRKRLSAEVLLDAICSATGVPEKFTDFPAGTRAVQLPDTQVVNTGGSYASWDRHPFLKAFGQPAREVACECEREGDVSLARVLELKNGSFIHQKIQTPDNRLGKLLAQKLPATQILDELFLASLARRPLAHEATAALELIAQATDERTGWEGVLWALLNMNEFFLRY